MNKAETGHLGEAAAAKFYQKKGCLLLNHNYRTRYGEIDLILLEGDTLVFVEVKTRALNSRTRPAEAVDARKQQRLILAAKQYLAQSPLGDSPTRFDVAEVWRLENGWQIHCIPAAFEC